MTTFSKISGLALAAACAFASPAMAVQYNNYDSTFQTGGFGDTNTPGTGGFTGIYNFVVTRAGTLSTYVQNLSATAPGDIDFLSATLTGGTLVGTQNYTFRTVAFGGNPDGDEQGSYFNALIGPGTYTLTVRGNAGSTASYTGDFTVSGAVPEPATWALMIGGIGLAGAGMRRRRTIAAIA